MAFLCFAFLSSGETLAADRFSILGSRPVPDGGAFLSLIETVTLKPLQFTIGTSFDYAQNPLRANVGATKVNIVKRYFAESFYGTLGLADWISISFDLPVIWLNSFSNPDTLTPSSNQLDPGDIELSLKFRLLDRDKYPLGIALVPFGTMPTGREEHFMGDVDFTIGGKLLIDAVIGERVTLALNTGAVARKHVNAYGLNFGEQFLVGCGVSVKATDFLSVSAEVESRTPFEDFFKTKNTTPTEVRTGLQWTLGREKRFLLNTGGGFGINYGAGSPHYRLIIGFTFRPTKK